MLRPNLASMGSCANLAQNSVMDGCRVHLDLIMEMELKSGGH